MTFLIGFSYLILSAFFLTKSNSFTSKKVELSYHILNSLPKSTSQKVFTEKNLYMHKLRTYITTSLLLLLPSKKLYADDQIANIGIESLSNSNSIIKSVENIQKQTLFRQLLSDEFSIEFLNGSFGLG